MKLIISELNAYRRYVTREFWFIIEEMRITHGWAHAERYPLWNAPGSMREKLLAQFGELPEIIFFTGGFDFIDAHLAELGKLGARLCYFVDDLHPRDESARQQARRVFDSCDLILAAYQPVFADFYPGVAKRREIAWLPHAASPDFFGDPNPNPESAVLLSGAISQHYPLRQKMLDLHEQHPDLIKHHPHPGYHCGHDYENGSFVGTSYASIIQSALAAFTDGSIFRYVLAKHFEITAAGSLLIAENAVSPLLAKLGFQENEHYVATNGESLENCVRAVLDPSNRTEMDAIRCAGRELTLSRHKTSDRAELIDRLCCA